MGNLTTQASEGDDFVLAGHKDTLEEKFEKGPFEPIEQLSSSDIPQREEIKKLLENLWEGMRQRKLDHPSKRAIQEVISTQQELTDSCKQKNRRRRHAR